MNKRKIYFAAFFTLLVILIAGISGCTNQSETASDDNSDSEKGRIIVPDTDWPEAEPSDDTTADSVDSSDDTDGEADPGTSDESDSEENDGSSGEPDTLFKEQGVINIDLYMNEVLQNPEYPVEVINLTLTEVEFRITSTGPELDSYQIENAGPVNLPWTGELEGNEATIKYEFTYNDGYWEDWGIIIFVRNKVGDSVSKNYKVVPMEIPGFPSGR